MLGSLSVNNQKALHAYNIFSTQNSTLILYDVTNPVELNEKEKYAPAVTIIGQEDIGNVETIKLDFDFIQEHWGQIDEEEIARERIYTTCNHTLNHTDSRNKKI